MDKIEYAVVLAIFAIISGLSDSSIQHRYIRSSQKAEKKYNIGDVSMMKHN
jgi:hypothetical protein